MGFNLLFIQNLWSDDKIKNKTYHKPQLNIRLWVIKSNKLCFEQRGIDSARRPLVLHRERGETL